MGRWHQRLGSLSWRLILSYLLVTLVVTLTMGGVLVVSQLMRAEQQVGASSEDVLGKVGMTSLGSALEQATPDPEALRYLVATPLFDDLKLQQPRLSLVAILDHQAQLLTATACGRQSQLASATAPSCAAKASKETDALLASTQVET